MQAPKILFEHGTLIIHAQDWTQAIESQLSNFFQYDQRVFLYRAKAYYYRRAILNLHQNNIPFKDEVKAFTEQNFKPTKIFTSRHYQDEALNAWLSAGKRGCVILPTGAGKTFFAMKCIEKVKRNTLILVPTLHLMDQWVKNIHDYFGVHVGRLGGGEKDLQAITVSTYDSAYLSMEYHGNKFGFLIADEAHHLPGNQYKMIAEMSIAPFRLGLTATPERSDGRESLLYHYMGQVVYQQSIGQLKGQYLSHYKTKCIEVELDPEEQNIYDTYRKQYLTFIDKNNINFGNGSTWEDFIKICFRQPEGRKVYEAFLQSKKLCRQSSEKFKQIFSLMIKHKNDKILIFTEDNTTAYDLGEKFLLPVLTHQTPKSERTEFLNGFKTNQYKILVTSKVLNEGVDVPEANIAIIVSGSSSKREHVQRLGRILRKQEGKSALLYELITKNTSEKWQSRNRRQHEAYKYS